MNGSVERFHVNGCSIVDFMSYTLANIQKAFSNREAPVGEDPAHY